MIERLSTFYKKLSLYYKFQLAIIGLFLLVLIIFFLPAILPKEMIRNTRVHGLIIRDQVWSGTIRLDGDILTLPGTSITIEMGTNVIVSKNGDQSNFDFLPWHSKQGINTGPFDHGVETGDPFWDEGQKISLKFARLYSLGTKQYPITITSEDINGSRFDINQISIQQGNIDFTHFSNYRKLKVGDKVTIKNSKFNNSDECSICINQGNSQIISSNFQNSQKGYIRVDGGSPLISSNYFWESSSDGIVYWGDYTTVNVYENFFQLPSQRVIKIIRPYTIGAIARNFISSGDIELPCNSNVKVIHNLIKSKVIFRSENNCQGEYIFDQNYWDTKERDEILNARIVGSTSKFKVKIPFVLTAPPPNVPNPLKDHY